MEGDDVNSITPTPDSEPWEKYPWSDGQLKLIKQAFETHAADLKRKLEEIQPRYDDEDVYIGCCECLQRIEEFFFVERENRQLRSELAALKTSAEDWHKVADDRSREIVRLREERDKLKTYCSALEEQLDSFGLQRAREKAP